MPSLVFPVHDPDNQQFELLKSALPLLKQNFDRAFVSPTPKTEKQNPKLVSFLKKDKFFILNSNPQDSPACDHFINAFHNAVKLSNEKEVLHLCALDRLLFALQTKHCQAFLNDINNIIEKECPTLFVRSPKAWATHPKNYYAVESMLNVAGKILFDRNLDYAWCHLVLTAGQLKLVLPKLTPHSPAFFTQLLLPLRNTVQTKKVDWLSWEDPYIFNKDPKIYKKERENDPKETEKRLAYVQPGIKLLFEEHKKLTSRITGKTEDITI